MDSRGNTAVHDTAMIASGSGRECKPAGRQNFDNLCDADRECVSHPVLGKDDGVRGDALDHSNLDLALFVQVPDDIAWVGV